MLEPAKAVEFERTTAAGLGGVGGDSGDATGCAAATAIVEAAVSAAARSSSERAAPSSPFTADAMAAPLPYNSFSALAGQPAWRRSLERFPLDTFCFPHTAGLGDASGQDRGSEAIAAARALASARGCGDKVVGDAGPPPAYNHAAEVPPSVAKLLSEELLGHEAAYAEWVADSLTQSWQRVEAILALNRRREHFLLPPTHTGRVGCATTGPAPYKGGDRGQTRVPPMEELFELGLLGGPLYQACSEAYAARDYWNDDCFRLQYNVSSVLDERADADGGQQELLQGEVELPSDIPVTMTMLSAQIADMNKRANNDRDLITIKRSRLAQLKVSDRAAEAVAFEAAKDKYIRNVDRTLVLEGAARRFGPLRRCFAAILRARERFPPNMSLLLKSIEAGQTVLKGLEDRMQKCLFNVPLYQPLRIIALCIVRDLARAPPGFTVSEQFEQEHRAIFAALLRAIRDLLLEFYAIDENETFSGLEGLVEARIKEAQADEERDSAQAMGEHAGAKSRGTDASAAAAAARRVRAATIEEVFDEEMSEEERSAERKKREKARLLQAVLASTNSTNAAALMLSGDTCGDLSVPAPPPRSSYAPSYDPLTARQGSDYPGCGAITFTKADLGAAMWGVLRTELAAREQLHHATVQLIERTIECEKQLDVMMETDVGNCRRAVAASLGEIADDATTIITAVRDCSARLAGVIARAEEARQANYVTMTRQLHESQYRLHSSRQAQERILRRIRESFKELQKEQERHQQAICDTVMMQLQLAKSEQAHAAFSRAAKRRADAIAEAEKTCHEVETLISDTKASCDNILAQMTKHVQRDCSAERIRKCTATRVAVENCAEWRRVVGDIIAIHENDFEDLMAKYQKKGWQVDFLISSTIKANSSRLAEDRIAYDTADAAWQLLCERYALPFDVSPVEVGASSPQAASFVSSMRRMFIELEYSRKRLRKDPVAPIPYYELYHSEGAAIFRCLGKFNRRREGLGWYYPRPLTKEQHEALEEVRHEAGGDKEGTETPESAKEAISCIPEQMAESTQLPPNTTDYHPQPFTRHRHQQLHQRDSDIYSTHRSENIMCGTGIMTSKPEEVGAGIGALGSLRVGLSTNAEAQAPRAGLVGTVPIAFSSLPLPPAILRLEQELASLHAKHGMTTAQLAEKRKRAAKGSEAGGDAPDEIKLEPEEKKGGIGPQGEISASAAPAASGSTRPPPYYHTIEDRSDINNAIPADKMPETVPTVTLIPRPPPREPLE